MMTDEMLTLYPDVFKAGASYYGVLQPPDLKWHIPSHHVTPDHSPTLQAFLDHVEHVAKPLHAASLQLVSHVSPCYREVSWLILEIVAT